MDAHPWRGWRHVVKLDPDRPMPEAWIEKICSSGTDALLIGGTQGITSQNTAELVGRITALRDRPPVWQEISREDAIVAGVDGYAIPVVLNARDTKWLIGKHAAVLHRVGHWVDWDRIVAEGYIVLNPDAAVFHHAGCMEVESPWAYALAAERLLGMKTIYVECSGRFGDMEQLKELRRMVAQAHLVYGGGIGSYETAYAAAAWADTIVVGNAVYEQGPDVLPPTIQGAKDASRLPGFRSPG
jgi:putative glycerol-1-phosphate prenyltransferase